MRYLRRIPRTSLERTVSSLPFRVSKRAILMVKELPVWECGSCTEFLIDDEVMGRIEELIGRVDEAAELEVVDFAA
jgi:YgiT-type zinc finger domain-containing protein